MRTIWRVGRSISVGLMLIVGLGCHHLLEESGPDVQESRDVASFHAVDIRIPGDFYIDQGARQSLSLSGNESVLRHIRTWVDSRGVLVIEHDQPWLWHSRVQVDLTIPVIDGIEVSGSARIMGRGSLTMDELALTVDGSASLDIDVQARLIRTAISGSARVFLKGSAQIHEINADGSLTVDTLSLETDSCRIDISGSGVCRVTVQRELDVKIDGSGVVYYRGSPVIRSDIDGSGRVIRID